MVWVTTAIVGGAIVNGLVSSKAAKNASKAQVAAADAASQTQRDIFAQQTALQAPFRDAELAKQAKLMQHLGVGGDPNSTGYGDLSSGFMPANWMTDMDPGYNFRLSEGMKALDHRLAASGMNASGAGLKAGIRYGQDYASNEYQNAFARYQTSRNATLSPLMGDPTATNTLTNAAGNMGNNIANNQLDAGNARASGYVGGANAWNSAITGGLNSFIGYQTFNSPNSQPQYNTGYYDPAGGYNRMALYPQSLGGNGGI